MSQSKGYWERAEAPKSPVLGPWQVGWDAWNAEDTTIKTLTADHFQTTILTQILEVREALAKGDTAHAAKECNDIISVTLNWIRQMGLTPEQIATAAESRGAQRYAGQTADIMHKYRTKYGI